MSGAPKTCSPDPSQHCVLGDYPDADEGCTAEEGE